MNASGADKRAKQVQKLGLKAEVAERKLQSSVYWVDVTPPTENTSVPIDDLLDEGVGSKVGVQACRRQPCPLRSRRPWPTAGGQPPAATASATASPHAAAAATPKLP